MAVVARQKTLVGIAPACAALRLAEAHAGGIDLLVTDYFAIRKMHILIRPLFVSGKAHLAIPLELLETIPAPPQAPQE